MFAFEAKQIRCCESENSSLEPLPTFSLFTHPQKYHMKEECDILREIFASQNKNEVDDIGESLHNLVLPVRIALLKHSQPQVFKSLLQLEGHAERRVQIANRKVRILFNGKLQVVSVAKRLL